MYQEESVRRGGNNMNTEGINTEYKREYVEDIKKTVVAFANTIGGKIYLGIDNDGQIIGVQDYDQTMLKITNTIRDSIKPDITLFTSYHKEILEEKVVIIITVQKGTACPYYLAGKGIRPEGVYVRQGASSVPASETTIFKMIKETAGDNYEEIRSLNQDLTFESLKLEFVESNIKIDPAKIKTLHLIGEDDLYSNLGLLLSDQCPHTIKAAVFEGNTKEIFKDRYEFAGSLFKQLKDCYSFIDRYNSTKSEFEGLRRIDKRSYPTTAIREALLNSIVHRDYAYSGSTLISIFDDRIEFVTFGGLVKGIAKDDMILGVSMLRNKNLANIFYRLKLIEAFGTGIPKIMESYHTYLIEPKIDITDNAFKITLYNTDFIKKPINDSFNSLLNEGEQKVIDIFKDVDSLRRKDIEMKLSISQPMAIKHLKNLLEKEVIKKIGSGKNVRYYLSGK